MWVTKLLISQVKKRIFCPKTTKFGPKLAFLVDLGQAMQVYSMPCCGSVGGCGARAVSRKAPFYFMIINSTMQRVSAINPILIVSPNLTGPKEFQNISQSSEKVSKYLTLPRAAKTLLPRKTYFDDMEKFA